MDAVVALVVLVVVVVLFIWGGIVALATPAIAYRFGRRVSLAAPEFAQALSSALGTPMVGGNRIRRLENASAFYPEMLAAIAGAKRSIALECYIFHPGATGDAFTIALAARAAVGVAVHIVLDAFGSRRLRRHDLRRLAEAAARLRGIQGANGAAPTG